MKRYGIIGYPLGHSFSKKYFDQKFLREGLEECCYEVFLLPAVAGIRELLDAHPDLAGLNVTIPHKRSILPFLSDRSAIPVDLGACNCIRIRNGELVGYNTDIIGFERSLLPLLDEEISSALILGNGGAAAAVKYVLQKLQIRYTIVSRSSPDGSALTYAQLDEPVMRENRLIINTTPLGTFPAIAECPDIPYRYLGRQHVLYDLVYNPEKTLFLQKGETQGARIKNGYDMLVIQAEESWRIWNAG